MDQNLPSSNEMGILAENKYQNNEFEDVAYFEPYYLKDFIAGFGQNSRLLSIYFFINHFTNKKTNCIK